MRGKEVNNDIEDVCSRITPAYAGKRLKASHASIRLSGSPPPMRGKVRIFTDSCGGQGITPAYAGKSSAVCPLDNPP